jgi:predicted kinase
MKPFVLQIHGPICSGKTTIVKILHKELPRTFIISADRLKWLMSDYQPKADRETISLMVLDIIKRALEAGWNVIQDSSMLWIEPATKKMYQDYYEENGIIQHHFNLEAPLPVLLHRLQTRIEEERKGNMRILIKDETAYMRSYTRYQEIKKDYPTFDTTEKEAQTIAIEILEHINHA